MRVTFALSFHITSFAHQAGKKASDRLISRSLMHLFLRNVYGNLSDEIYFKRRRVPLNSRQFFFDSNQTPIKMYLYEHFLSKLRDY